MALLKVWVGQGWVRDYVSSLSQIEGLKEVRGGEEHVYFEVPGWTEEAVGEAHRRLRKAGVNSVLVTSSTEPSGDPWRDR